MKLNELADRINGTVIGDPEVEIACVCGVDEQHDHAITFAENLKAIAQAERQGFAALVIPAKFNSKLPSIVVDNPRVGYAKLLTIFNPPIKRQPGIHATAIIGPNAKIADSAYIGPYAIIGEDSVVGENAVIEAHVSLGNHVCVGDGTHICAHVNMEEGCEIGAQCLVGAHTLISAGAKIGDDVEIGARAILEGCQISPKCRLDNMTLVRPDAFLAPGVIMVSHSSVHEGAQVGMFCILAAQAVVQPNAKVGNFATVGGRVVVETEIPEGSTQWSGNPPLPHREDMRRLAQRDAVPKLVKALSQQVQEKHRQQ